MTFGLLAPIANLNRAIRLVAVSSLLGNVINDSLPRVDFKTNLGGLRLALTSRDLFKTDTSTEIPEVVKITHEIEDRLDEIQESVRKHQKLMLEERASKRSDLPQLIQLQVVHQPPPVANSVQFSSGQLHFQQQQVQPQQIQSLPQFQIQPQTQFQQLQQVQSVQQQRPILMRLIAVNSANSGLLNQTPSSSAILLFQNSHSNHQLNGQFVSTTHQLQQPTLDQLIQQTVPVQSATTHQQPQVVTMENLAAALTHAAYGSTPSLAAGAVAGNIDPRGTELKVDEQRMDEDEDESNDDEEKADEKKRKKSKRGKSRD